MVRQVGKAVGGRIRDLRKQAGITQAELAELAEIEPESLSRIEGGKLQPSLKTLDRIAASLQVPAARLHDDSPVVLAKPPLRAVDRRILRLMAKLDEREAEVLLRSVENLLQLGASFDGGMGKKSR